MRQHFNAREYFYSSQEITAEVTSKYLASDLWSLLSRQFCWINKMLKRNADSESRAFVRSDEARRKEANHGRPSEINKIDNSMKKKTFRCPFNRRRLCEWIPRKPLGRGRLSMVRRRVNCVSALNWSWKTVAPEVFHQRCIKRLQDTRSSNMSNTRQWMKQVSLTCRKKMGALYRSRSLQKRLVNLELKVGFGLGKERCGFLY